jgi:antitoxin PrlF
MQTVTVSEQGQVIIPIDIRNKLGITAGCQIDLILENAGLRVRPCILDSGTNLSGTDLH